MLQVKAGNSSKVLAQMTLNATTMSVMLNNLTTSATYNIRVVAYTRVGAGPYSQPVRFKQHSFQTETHFIESAAAVHNVESAFEYFMKSNEKLIFDVFHGIHSSFIFGTKCAPLYLLSNLFRCH